MRTPHSHIRVTFASCRDFARARLRQTNEIYDANFTKYQSIIDLFTAADTHTRR